MRVTILASGSGGNATLVQAGGTRLLVDAGIGPQLLERRMTEVFGKPVGVDAIVATHAHGDHIGQLAPCAQHFGARVYMTEATHRRLRLPAGMSPRLFGPGAVFAVGAIEVAPCAVPHDAPQVALVFEHAGARAALVTDLGEVPRRLVDHLRGCQLVLLESNHDPDMLRLGPYPEFLKRRVASRLGHLSNAQAAELIAQLGRDTVEVVLMHVSQRNNSPALAVRTARAALRDREVKLRAAHQDRPIDLWVRAGATRRARVHESQLALPL